MTIGILAVIDTIILTSYEIIVVLIIAGFAIYDFCYKRVPNVGLFYFLPIVLLATVLSIVTGDSIECDAFIYQVLFRSLVGGLLGGGLLLLIAIITNGGIGGGDIKLVALLGWIYGGKDIIFILLVASISGTIYVFFLMIIKKKVEKQKTIAFIPFVLIGCLLLLKSI